MEAAMGLPCVVMRWTALSPSPISLSVNRVTFPYPFATHDLLLSFPLPLPLPPPHPDLAIFLRMAPITSMKAASASFSCPAR